MYVCIYIDVHTYIRIYRHLNLCTYILGPAWEHKLSRAAFIYLHIQLHTHIHGSYIKCQWMRTVSSIKIKTCRSKLMPFAPLSEHTRKSCARTFVVVFTLSSNCFGKHFEDLLWTNYVEWKLWKLMPVKPDEKWTQISYAICLPFSKFQSNESKSKLMRTNAKLCDSYANDIIQLRG